MNAEQYRDEARAYDCTHGLPADGYVMFRGTKAIGWAHDPNAADYPPGTVAVFNIPHGQVIERKEPTNVIRVPHWCDMKGGAS